MEGTINDSRPEDVMPIYLMSIAQLCGLAYWKPILTGHIHLPVLLYMRGKWVRKSFSPLLERSQALDATSSLGRGLEQDPSETKRKEAHAVSCIHDEDCGQAFKLLRLQGALEQPLHKIAGLAQEGGEP